LVLGKNRALSETAQSELYTKASVQKLESKLLQSKKEEKRVEERCSETLLNEVHYSRKYLYISIFWNSLMRVI
jgi:competence protein ComGF